MARQERVDVAGYLVVEVQLRGGELEGHGYRMALGEELASVEIAQLLLHAPQEPGIPVEAEQLTVQFAVPVHPVGVHKLIGVQQTQKVGKLIGVPLVGGGRQQQEALGLGAQSFGQLIALRLLHFPAVGPGRALVCFVNDHQVPICAQDTRPDVVLFGKVDGGDALREAIPDVARQLVLGQLGADDLEDLVELGAHLVLPLDGQGRGTEDQDALDGAPHLEFLH